MKLNEIVSSELIGLVKILSVSGAIILAMNPNECIVYGGLYCLARKLGGYSK